MVGEFRPPLRRPFRSLALDPRPSHDDCSPPSRPGGSRRLGGVLVSDEPENLVLRYLRRIDGRLERIEHRLDQLTGRVGQLEQSLALTHREIGFLHQEVAALSVRMDRFDERFGRVERRLDLIDVPA